MQKSTTMHSNDFSVNYSENSINYENSNRILYGFVTSIKAADVKIQNNVIAYF